LRLVPLPYCGLLVRSSKVLRFRVVRDEVSIKTGKSQNDRTSVTLVGLGQSATPCVLVGSIWMVPFWSITPRNSILFVRIRTSAVLGKDR